MTEIKIKRVLAPYVQNGAKALLESGLNGDNMLSDGDLEKNQFIL